MVAYPHAVIMVFCKAPIPGQVKTRLIPSLTGDEAAQLHCELTQKTLQTATQNRLCEVQLWCSPDIDQPFFTLMSQIYPISLNQQKGSGLGERMHHAFCEAFNDFTSVIIIGCDCPSLTGGDLEQALSQLDQGNPCVLAPAEDGGYVLIGLKQPQPYLFEDMPWGSEKIFELTRAKLQAMALNHVELRMQWDLDTLEDLKRYKARTN